MTYNNISIDDPQKDYETIIENMMRELCKRQRERGKNDVPLEFLIDDLWHEFLGAFTSRDYVLQRLEEFQRLRGYIEIINDKYIHLSQKGRNYCRDLEKQQIFWL